MGIKLASVPFDNIAIWKTIWEAQIFVIVDEVEDEDEDEDDVSMMQRHQMCVIGLSSPAQLPWAWPTHTKDNYMTQAKMWRSQWELMFFVFVRILPIGMGRMPKKRTTGQNIDAVQNFLHLKQIPEPLFPISGGLLVFILLYISSLSDVFDPYPIFVKLCKQKSCN